MRQYWAVWDVLKKILMWPIGLVIVIAFLIVVLFAFVIEFAPVIILTLLIMYGLKIGGC